MKEDLATVHEIDRQAFGGIANDFVTIRQMFDTAGKCFFVGQDKGKLVGYSSGCRQFGTDDGWLLDLAVLPTSQGAGFGRKLAIKVISTLINAGVGTIRLVVQPENNAIRLYEKLGFIEEYRESNYYGTGERMVMVIQNGKRYECES
jgi:ribosomal-protein-alanine N-acetyltransferase